MNECKDADFEKEMLRVRALEMGDAYDLLFKENPKLKREYIFFYIKY